MNTWRVKYKDAKLKLTLAYAELSCSYSDQFSSMYIPINRRNLVVVICAGSFSRHAVDKPSLCGYDNLLASTVASTTSSANRSTDHDGVHSGRAADYHRGRCGGGSPPGPLLLVPV